MKKKRQIKEDTSDCDTSSMSSAVTSSMDGERSLMSQQSAADQEPIYNINVSYPVIHDQAGYQPQQYPTYQNNIPYYEEMGVYPTEYYPTSYDNSSYGFADNGFERHVSPAAGWYGCDVNGFGMEGWYLQQ